MAYSKIKKRNLVLINNATYQRETLSERPIRQPLNILDTLHSALEHHTNFLHQRNSECQLDLTSAVPSSKEQRKLNPVDILWI